MMVTAGILIAHREVAVAAIPFGCFLLTNLIAYALWMCRKRFDPFLSLMTILAVMAVTIPIAWIATGTWASPEILSQMNWPSAAGWNLAAALLAPGLMVWFYILESRAKSKHSLSQ